MAIKHPDSDLKDYLRANIDLSGVRATIDTSAIDRENPEVDEVYPRITIGGLSTTPLSAGSRSSGNTDTTGWTGSSGDGSGPMQTTYASLQISCFAGTEQTDALEAHPYNVSDDMLTAVTDTIDGTPPTGYQSMGYTSRGDLPEHDEDPPVYGEYVIIAMTYHDQQA